MSRLIAAVSLPRSNLPAFGVWLISVSLLAPRPTSSSTSGKKHTNAAPEMHFGENQDCTQFHWPSTPTHRLSPRFSTLVGSGPRPRSTRASTCPWVDHSASGSQHATQAPYSDSSSTATPHGLTLPHIVTRRLILQKARGHFTSAEADTLPLLVRAHGFRYDFTTLTGVLFTFPSRYWFTIGHQGVFRLRRWSSRIHTCLHGLRATWDTVRESSKFRVAWGYHPLCRCFPTSSGQVPKPFCNSLPRSAAPTERSRPPRPRNACWL